MQNPDVQQLIAALEELPQAEQSAMARTFLADLQWELTLSSSASQRRLKELAEEADYEHRNGLTKPVDELLSATLQA